MRDQGLEDVCPEERWMSLMIFTLAVLGPRGVGVAWSAVMNWPLKEARSGDKWGGEKKTWEAMEWWCWWCLHFESFDSTKGDGA